MAKDVGPVGAPSGWRLQHCGHPTALLPRMLFDPENRMVLSGLSTEGGEDPMRGRCWVDLRLPVHWLAWWLASPQAARDAATARWQDEARNVPIELQVRAEQWLHPDEREEPKSSDEDQWGGQLAGVRAELEAAPGGRAPRVDRLQCAEAVPCCTGA